MLKKIQAYVRLFRIEHAFMLSFAVLLSILLAGKIEGDSLPSAATVAISLAVPFFIEMASFALNDFFDVKTDRENKRDDRPIASGEISQKTALYMSIVLYVLGVGLSLFLHPLAFQIALAFALLSVAYNYKLKELPLIGNMYIAASMAIPFIFGNVVVSDGAVYRPIFAIAAVAFFAGLGREIIKSVEDMEGDVKHRDASTLPVLIGKFNSVVLATAFYHSLLLISFAPYYFGIPANLLAIGLTAVSAFSFLAIAISIAKNQSQEKLVSARKASLLALGVGLLGYAAALL